MENHDVFWKLEALSDRQLLERMGSILGSSRRLMAELIAHLGEVEERRLHLAAACSSMFAYCLKLGMTEDEAYRRIEVARLARRYPAIFPLLATGQLTLSVVALLKHHLSDENHLELLAATRGKTVGQTRELIAARFPRPDVPSSVRKVPERRTTTMQPSLTLSTPEEPRASGEPRAGGTETTVGGMETTVGGTKPTTGGMETTVGGTEPTVGGTEPTIGGTETTVGGTKPTVGGMETTVGGMETCFTSKVTEPRRPGMEPRTGSMQPSHFERAAPPRVSSSRIEALSAQRYKVQFTASGELARKLELARDLMRHCHPGGELGPIVERALDLLIDGLMQRRFGKSKKASARRARGCAKPEPRADVMGDRFAMQRSAEPDSAEPEPATAKPEPRADVMGDRFAMQHTIEPATAKPALASPTLAGPTLASPTLASPTLADAAAHDDIKTHDAAIDPDTTLETANIEAGRRAAGERASTPYIPRCTRRTVVERDGLGCSWIDEQGARCGSRAWLEYDHRRPRAKGGGSEPGNLRLLCRHHNRLAAEQEYGRRHVEHAIAERRREHAPHAI